MRLVPTGDEALDGFVLVGIDLPRRVSVDLAVHWQVPGMGQRRILNLKNGKFRFIF